MRGQQIAGLDGQAVYMMVHPSYLLRLLDADAKEREYAQLVPELQAAQALGRELRGAEGLAVPAGVDPRLSA